MRSKLELCASCTGFLPAHLSSCPNCGKSRKSTMARFGALGGALGSGAIAFTLMACYGAPCANDDVCRGDYDAGGEDDSGRDANKPDVQVAKDAAADADNDDAAIGDAGDGG